MRSLCIALAGLLGLAAQAQTPPAVAPPKPEPVTSFEEVMIPMRDGVRLQTVIMRPTSHPEPLPILIRRTPYGVPDAAPKEIPAYLKPLMADGYILVIQNLRGRFKSEGTFRLSEDVRLTPGQGTIETRDAWDTVDWLVKHVPNTNGRVGALGVSYDGYTAGAMLLGPHPALKAISEQASPGDQWMNDDDHRYGALRLSYAFEYAVLEEQDKTANTHFAFDQYDTYSWYLAHGSAQAIDDYALHGKIAYFREAIEHPDRDAFWQGQDWVAAVSHSSVPNLNVAGFWDQEDPFGPWRIFRQEKLDDPRGTALMVAGPWFHGAWHANGASTLGIVPLGQDTAMAYRKNIEAPFFAYWLHGKGEQPGPTVRTFQTGSNSWKSYGQWPPAQAKPTSLYLHGDGRLDFTAPGPAEATGHRTYVSDPSSPVPYRARPISPTYPGGDWRMWEAQDQRFVDGRPDVLTFVSAPLDHDLTVTGNVAAVIFASTSGTDADIVVKLIDVFPEDAQPSWNADLGPPPGQYGQKLNGYELPIAMEVRRGRYLASFEHPTALTPNVPIRWDVPLRARDHVFLKGHKIMVQIQSTWFPVIDRNPQTFVANIYKSKADDYRTASQTVFATPEFASRIILPVIDGSKDLEPAKAAGS
jgi:putative CocE/NonD family hydrolase